MQTIWPWKPLKNLNTLASDDSSYHIRQYKNHFTNILNCVIFGSEIQKVNKRRTINFENVLYLFLNSNSKSRSDSEKRSKCFFTYIHLDLFRYHSLIHIVLLLVEIISTVAELTAVPGYRLDKLW